MVNFQFILVFLLTVSVQKSFNSPVPHVDGQQAGQETIDEEKQLENLHKETSTAISPDDERQEKSEPKPEPKAAQGPASPIADSDGSVSPQPNSRSAIFRHRGITQAKKSKAWMNEHPDFSEYVKFSPSDLAEYVFRTGDEEGVAVAVEELVREGVMGRTDAINYLQDVKQELAYMKDQYDQQRRLQEMRNKIYSRPQMTQRLLSLPREQFVAGLDTEKREPRVPERAPVFTTTTEQHQQMVTASTPAPKLSTHSAGIAPKLSVEDANGPRDVSEMLQQDDMKRQHEHAEKAAAGASYYDEFALEDVIYQLAKNMFTQSVVRGDQSSEETLSRLVTFLEGEVGKKSISPQMKEKILGIVSTALIDSLREYQVLLSENQFSIQDESGSFKKEADVKGPPQGKANLPDAFRKLNISGQENSHQPPSSANAPRTS